MTGGPVSQTLEQELLQEVQRQGIVVWLDKDSSFTSFVDRLIAEHAAGGFAHPVVGFRGSFLEILFALETHGSSYEKHALLIHMPGFNEDTIRKTPVLELYEAGTRFRKSLDTLVRQAAAGRALPDEVEDFLRGTPTLEAADKWLSDAASKRAVGLEALLESSGPTLVVDALVRKDSSLAGRVTTEEEAQTLRRYLTKLTGMDDEWFSYAKGHAKLPLLMQVLHSVGAWLLCVEYVQDLRRKPHIPQLQRLCDLSSPLVAVCTRLVGELRAKHGDAYAELADETESFLDIELRQMTPEDLGHIDTFREEEHRILMGAVEALKTQEWDKVLAWCKEREGEKSFWLSRDPHRRRAWDLVAEAAAFGAALSKHPRPFEKLERHEQALAKYADEAAPVDRAHRRFEQEWLRQLDTQMPRYDALQEVLGTLRQLHRTWADRLAKDFTRLCKAEGFLPPTHLQQRTLYEEVVQPLAFGDEKVAVFLVDSFRYEMATELLDDLRAATAGLAVDLKARFAELPTVTSVGMNALAPVAKDGHLVVAGNLQGFRTGEYTVRTPSDRARAMGTRTSGKPALVLTLAEICDTTPADLGRKVKAHQVVVVCSTEIDDAGEANVGLLTFEAQLRQIKAAWHHLQAAGVMHAVITADHGFLLLDSTTELRKFGKETGHPRRYILDEHERGESGLVPVALSKLGYEGIGGYLLLPDDTAVFSTGTAGASFVHGGNSPEERIIPVLTITRKRVETPSLLEYAVEGEGSDEESGFQKLRLRVQDTRHTLGFAGARTIDLDLRVPDRKDIRVTLKEVSGAGAFKAGRIRSPVGDTWTEVLFTLEGPADDRVKVEIHHADSIENVRSAVPDALFAVSGTGIKRAPTAPPPASAWAAAIEDESIRSVFAHIAKHGSVTETEIISMLGSPRAARRFAVNFEVYLAKLPFKVRSESNESGKRYVREEDK